VIESLEAGGLYDGEIKQISMLGSSEKLILKRTADGLTINRPKIVPDFPVTGFRIISLKKDYPSDYTQPIFYPAFDDLLHVSYG
jgi:hypothetical protein